MANLSEPHPCVQLTEHGSEDTMQYAPSISPSPSLSMESFEEDDRGRLLIRIPGKVRSPGRPRTLRHTGPSIHHWLQRNNGSPVRNSPLNSSFNIGDETLDSRSSQQKRAREKSPRSRSSVNSALSGSLDLLESNNLSAAQRRRHKNPTNSIADANEHLSLSDDGVTVSRILSISPHSPNRFIRHYDSTFLSDPAVGREWALRSNIPRRPTPVTVGMRYSSLWEWVCSDSVPTSRVESVYSGILNPPGRFVEYESFAIHYAFLDSMSRESNAATGIRTEDQS